MIKPSTKLKLLDLFSGIGGFSLGLERSNGFETVAFCEIEPFCRKVLAKHWPTIPCYDDIKTLTKDRLHADGIIPDAICGGFPCQDISTAGKGAGIEGKRSGLWSEYARLIGEIRPRYIIVENVAALLGRGLSRVLGDLAALGYDAEWHCIPASAVAAPHRRNRIWIVAYPRDDGWVESGCDAMDKVARKTSAEWREKTNGIGYGCKAMVDAARKSLVGSSILWPHPASWAPEPDICRVVDGVPRELVEPRLKALGNAVVPQIAEMIGRAIMAAETAK